MSLLNPALDEHTFDLALNALSTIFTFLLLLGFFVTLRAIYRIFRNLHIYYLHTSALPRYLHGRPHHAYALVTGASDGIGRAFAHALAARGFNLILHGRNAAKLADLVETMQTTYPSTSFRTLIADAGTSHGMKSAIEIMVNELSTLPGPLTVLVNNVGGAGTSESPFKLLASSSSSDVDTLLNLNVRFTVQLTRGLLPMLTRVENQPSLILNSGSAAARLAMPYMSVHAATKAFLRSWTESLAHEMVFEHGDGVQVMLASIGSTMGAGGRNGKASWIAPSADIVADGALDRVGCGIVCVAPTPGQALVEGVLASLPGWVVRAVFARVARREMGTRAGGGRESETIGGTKED